MRCMNQARNSVLLKSVLISVIFGLLYWLSAPMEAKTADEILMIKDVFAITDADRYVGTENAVPLLLDGTDDYIIQRGGRYLLSGDMQGTLFVDAQDQHVHLILDNVSITGHNGPAVSVLSAGKIFITGLENTVNSLGDSASYEAGRSENACIYSTAELTFNGTGELLITGLFEDAVYCRDTLKVLSSNLKIQSKRDCIRGNDGVLIQGSNITLEAERNGVRTTNSGQAARGDVEIRSADLSIIAGSYCVNSASDLYVHQSDCFFKGLLGNYKVAGEVLAQEECLSYG